MHVSGVMIWFILGPVGVLFALGAIPFAIYSLFTRKPGRGGGAGKTALVLSLLAVLASAVTWFEVIAMLAGPQAEYRDEDIVFYEFVVIVEAVALLLALLAILRHRLRRAPPSSMTP